MTNIERIEADARRRLSANDTNDTIEEYADTAIKVLKKFFSGRNIERGRSLEKDEDYYFVNVSFPIDKRLPLLKCEGQINIWKNGKCHAFLDIKLGDKIGQTKSITDAYLIDIDLDKEKVIGMYLQ